MLWILAGAPNSGKKTFRDLLIKEYGFKAIVKYTGTKTANGPKKEGIFLFGVNNIAKRDIYLWVPTDEELVEDLNEIDETTDPKKRSDLIDAFKNKQLHEFPSKIIYAKDDVNEPGFYFLYEDDVLKAACNENAHYVLVCSDDETIGYIKELCRNKGANYLVKCIYLFGYTGRNAKELDSSTGQLKKLLNNNGFMESIDYVIANLRTKEGFENNLRRQWENLVINSWSVYEPIKKLVPIKLIEGTDSRFKSGIFFTKPFPKNGDKKRAELIYEAINKIASYVSACYKVHRAYNGSDDVYCVGEVGPLGNTTIEPVQTVRYESEITPEIVSEVKKQIEEANLIVVDLTDYVKDSVMRYNPNCCWELGYARALHKRVLLLRDVKMDINLSDEGTNVYIAYEFEDNKFIVDTNHKLEEPRNRKFKDIEATTTGYIKFVLEYKDNGWHYSCEKGSNTTGYTIETAFRDYFKQLTTAITNRLEHISFESASKGTR